jgi:16S rRNA G527 N7-methylase RsmG
MYGRSSEHHTLVVRKTRALILTWNIVIQLTGVRHFKEMVLRCKVGHKFLVARSREYIPFIWKIRALIPTWNIVIQLTEVRHTKKIVLSFKAGPKSIVACSSEHILLVWETPTFALT